MFTKIRSSAIRLFAALVLIVVPLGAPALASAANTPYSINNCLGTGSNLTTNGLNNGCNSDKNTSQGTTGINNLIHTIINIFSLIVGIVSVIMIIVGGLRYITSGGDSNNVSAAKNTIIYAIIGLVVVALAQFIVQFVLNKVTQP